MMSEKSLLRTTALQAAVDRRALKPLITTFLAVAVTTSLTGCFDSGSSGSSGSGSGVFFDDFKATLEGGVSAQGVTAFSGEEQYHSCEPSGHYLEIVRHACADMGNLWTEMLVTDLHEDSLYGFLDSNAFDDIIGDMPETGGGEVSSDSKWLFEDDVRKEFFYMQGERLVAGRLDKVEGSVHFEHYTARNNYGPRGNHFVLKLTNLDEEFRATDETSIRLLVARRQADNVEPTCYDLHNDQTQARQEGGRHSKPAWFYLEGQLGADRGVSAFWMDMEDRYRYEEHDEPLKPVAEVEAFTLPVSMDASEITYWGENPSRWAETLNRDAAAKFPEITHEFTDGVNLGEGDRFYFPACVVGEGWDKGWSGSNAVKNPHLYRITELGDFHPLGL